MSVAINYQHKFVIDKIEMKRMKKKEFLIKRPHHTVMQGRAVQGSAGQCEQCLQGKETRVNLFQRTGNKLYNLINNYEVQSGKSS